MIKIENTTVMNLENALRGMRNPLQSWECSDSYYNEDGEYIVGDNDLHLALSLAKAGSDHRKYMRQIFVSIDLTAPWYFYKQFSTYKVNVTQNSTSMMHTLTNRILTEEDFGWDYLTDYRKVFLGHLNNLIEKIKKIEKQIDDLKINPDNWKTMRKFKDLQNEKVRLWRELQQDVGASFLYKRTITFNYENLRNIYHSRMNHKLSEWHEFCYWIEDLPYSELIIEKRKLEENNSKVS